MDKPAVKPWREQGKRPPVCLCLCLTEAGRVPVGTRFTAGASGRNKGLTLVFCVCLFQTDCRKTTRMFCGCEAVGNAGSDCAAHVIEPLSDFISSSGFVHLWDCFLLMAAPRLFVDTVLREDLWTVSH